MASTSSETESSSAQNVSFVANIPSDGESGNENSRVTVTLINNQKPATTTTDCDTLKRHVATPPRVDLSRADLIRLLSYLEGELQARDVVIATLKADKAKQMLYQAKYGRLGLNDPFAALQRDSETCGSNDDFDEASVGRLYESQLAHLERLIAVQRRAHQRAKQVLSAAERRHARSVRELEQERKRRAHDAAQGDDVCMMLEKERERLKQELENQKSDQAKVERDLEKARQSVADEKGRHKEIVMYLLQERRQLLVRLMEERQKGLKTVQHQQEGAETSFGGGGDESAVSKKANNEKTEDDWLKELESLRKQLDEEKKETSSLKEVVKTQEEDLNLIRQMILAKSRQAASQQQSPTAGGSVKSPGQSKSTKLENSNGNTMTTTATTQMVHATAATTPTSPSTTNDGRYQILSRPNVTVQQSPAVQRPIYQQQQQQQQQQHYASTDLGLPSPVTPQPPHPQQQPIRLLTNPAYQQQQQQPPPPAYYQSGGSIVTKTTAAPPPRGRSVPPPAPHSISTSASIRTSDRGDTSMTGNAPSSSNYAAPRVIPIQLIGPTPNTSAATSVVSSHQQPQYASVSAGGLRRPGVVATPPTPPTSQGSSMVSAARNYVSTVVAAVTNAATNSPLLTGGISGQRRGQTTAVAPSTASNNPLREQWSYAAQATSTPSITSDGGGYRPAQSPSSVNAHRVGVASSVYGVTQHQQQQQPQPTGSVSRKANPPSRTSSSATAGGGQQQVSEDGYGSDADRVAVEPEIAQLQAVINSMAGATTTSNLPPPQGLSGASASGGVGRSGNDPHGVKGFTSSRRPPSSHQQIQHQHQQQQQNFVSSSLPQSGGNSNNAYATLPTATVLRNRPPSPVSNIVVQQRSPVPNGMVIQSSVAVVASSGASIGTKRTPTPAPSNRTPLPQLLNGVPVPAVTRTSALSCSPTASTTDCNPPPISELRQRQQSPSLIVASGANQGTLGRKVKAMSSGLANKIQRRVVVPGVVGQVGQQPRQQRPANGDNGGKDQNIRSTQV